MTRRTLVVDVGGTNVKVRLSGSRAIVRIPSGKHMTAARMVREVRARIERSAYDRVSIGYPGPVRDGKPLAEPQNVGGGWRRMDFTAAFDSPVKLINDAAMQALGSYSGGRMLFLGLGTGLGSAVVEGDRVLAMELAHLPYREGKTYEDYLGVRGLERLGRAKWEKHVSLVSDLLRGALVCDHVVLGGGNAKKLRSLPAKARLGDNSNAFRGGERLWRSDPGAEASK